MTKKSNIWSILNLGLFIVSFVLFTVNTYTASFLIPPADTHHTRFIAQESPDLSVTRQQVSEKNENESDNVVDLRNAVLSLPYLTTFLLTSEGFMCERPSPLVGQGIVPIYLRLQNFRI